jgi:hypothetical protein
MSLERQKESFPSERQPFHLLNIGLSELQEDDRLYVKGVREEIDLMH